MVLLHRALLVCIKGDARERNEVPVTLSCMNCLEDAFSRNDPIGRLKIEALSKHHRSENI